MLPRSNELRRVVLSDASGSVVEAEKIILHIIFCLDFRNRKCEKELAAFTFGADYIDIFVVSSDDFLGNGEAKACAFLVLTTGWICFIESVENFMKTFFRNTNSVIFYTDKELGIFFLGFYFDFTVFITEFNRIIKKVIDNLLNLGFIRMHIHLFAC